MFSLTQSNRTLSTTSSIPSRTSTRAFHLPQTRCLQLPRPTMKAIPQRSSPSLAPTRCKYPATIPSPSRTAHAGLLRQYQGTRVSDDHRHEAYPAKEDIERTSTGHHLRFRPAVRMIETTALIYPYLICRLSLLTAPANALFRSSTARPYYRGRRRTAWRLDGLIFLNHVHLHPRSHGRPLRLPSLLIVSCSSYRFPSFS